MSVTLKVDIEVGDTAAAMAMLKELVELLKAEIANQREPLHEICHWPGSLVSLERSAQLLTVYWWDGICQACYRPAFDNVWARLGDSIEVVHRALDEMNDDELAPFEVVE